MDEKTIKVLLVEDDPDDAYLLRHTLADITSTQFEIVHAKRLSEALELGAAQRFDVGLLDLSLPDSNGLDTFLDAHEALPSLPLVVLTGLEDETLALSAVNRGAQDYLFKGQVSGHLLVRSIRYAIERQRASHYRAVLRERERFDAAVSQMSDGIVVMDEEWRISHANRAACLLLNLGADEWRGMSLVDALQPFSVSLAVQELMDSTEVVTSFEVSRPGTHPPLYIDGRLSRLFEVGDQLVSSVLVVRNVTDERMARHIQADFLTAAPHKLRTPLSVLMGYLTVAKHLSPTELAARWPQIAPVWESELRQLVDMVQKLLDFEALHDPLPVGEIQQALVSEAAQAVLARVRERRADRRLEAQVDIAVGSDIVACRVDHLGFVLGEIVDNAVKFADKDPVVVSLTAVREAPEWVRISIRDNGPGIPHEYYDRIFEDFMQVEEFVTGQVPGLGVGLRMARQVVTAYDGTLSVRSTLGEGSTFSFTLPAALIV